jgi:hypothetical protein
MPISSKTLREAAQPLARFDAGNWRKVMLDVSDAFFKGPEELQALAKLLMENLDVDAARWFREASVGKPAPLPAKRRDRLALVFKMCAQAPRKAGAASVSENIDLPFALENAYPGVSKPASYERFRAEVLAPFIAEVDRVAGALEAGTPLAKAIQG